MSYPADQTANPAPLGLLGFGMTTILLNLHNAGLYELNSMILAMGIFYGGLAQVFAGLLEWKKNNTFGMVAFTSYGLFWLALVALLMLPKMGLAAPVSTGGMVAFFVIWGVFTALMFVGTLTMNLATQVVFGSLLILFGLLAVGDALGSVTIGRLAGWEGILCGLSAVYVAMAQVLNEVHGRVLLPLGEKRV
jgi:succinate-acetate transporter protein